MIEISSATSARENDVRQIRNMSMLRMVMWFCIAETMTFFIAATLYQKSVAQDIVAATHAEGVSVQMVERLQKKLWFGGALASKQNREIMDFVCRQDPAYSQCSQ